MTIKMLNLLSDRLKIGILIIATKVFISTLVTLMLCAAVSAQTLRLPQDPRNQAPAVGTGGPVGGPESNAAVGGVGGAWAVDWA